MSALDRIPKRRLQKMSRDEHRAYDLLVFGHPGPADRCRAKVTLGLHPSRAEHLALTRDLLAAGASVGAIADTLAVTERSARRLLAEARSEVQTPEKRPDFPLNHAALADITDSPRLMTCPERLQGREVYMGQPGYDFGKALRRALGSTA